VQELTAAASVADGPPDDIAPSGSLVWGDTLMDHVVEHAAAARHAREAGHLVSGLPTGHGAVDRLLNGLRGAGLYVLGGAPGMGKTSLALQWACHAASEASASALYVTFENTPRNLALKAVSRLARVPPSVIERGREEPTRLAEGLRAFARFADRLCFLPGGSVESVADVEAYARAARRRHGAPRSLVVIDYLQRMAYRGRYHDLRENVSELSLRLRELAERLDSPVLALSSLSRQAADIDAPTLDALRESGDLEYAADVVLLLGTRKELTVGSAARARASGGARLLDLLVAKNRYGEANYRVPLLFNAAVGDFVEETSL
jgi:replicative DNA helicase